MMETLIRVAESGYLPDGIIRLGIRHLLRQRLADERDRLDGGESDEIFDRLKQEPIATATEQANEQHYELPAEFFRLMLGPRLKYSSCYWPSRGQTLAQAEEQMLELTCERAGVEDGMRVLDLGCGWGSLSLWIAEKFPASEVTAVSNSAPQGAFIRERAASLGLDNLTVLTEDINRLELSERFDRALSIEMFEHMRNYESLLARIGGWLEAQGKLFVHMFCHRRLAYLFQVDGNNDWMARHFFTGGTMPSRDLLTRFDRDLRVAREWIVEGTHYEQTLLAWLARLDDGRPQALRILETHYGPEQAQLWFVRWRLFLLGCAELFGYDEGREWMVGHYLLEPA